MNRKELISRIRERLAAVHGDRLRGIVLYGSEARGESEPDSDIDLLVLLQEPVDCGRDLEANLRALYPLAQETGRRISAKPVGADSYDRLGCPLYDAAHKEGVAI